MFLCILLFGAHFFSFLVCFILFGGYVIYYALCLTTTTFFLVFSSCSFCISSVHVCMLIFPAIIFSFLNFPQVIL